MPCSDSSSGLNIFLDKNEKFIRFEFAKITCSSEITAQTGLNDFFKGKSLEEILDLPFAVLVSALDLNENEEEQFILHLEWDALRSGIVQYLGIMREDVDSSRCQISSIEHTEKGIEISEVIFPPAEMPKILPCSMKNKESSSD